MYRPQFDSNAAHAFKTGAATRHAPQPIHGNPALAQLARAHRVLLLQGPAGAFFDRLTHWLDERGTWVHRVVLQAGDLGDARSGDTLAFRGPPQAWDDWLAEKLVVLDIDTLVLFGQARPLHARAMSLARTHGVAVVVLEEGYVRPGHATMELDGVNGYSTTLERYVHVESTLVGGMRTQPPASTRWHFQQMVASVCRHYAALHWRRHDFPHYQHHKESSVWHYLGYWGRSWARKVVRHWPDTRQVDRLASQPYFFVPLQHDGDSQITHHSPYGENTDFIIEVMRSFADHAPAQARLVLRQRPHARGGVGHEALIRSLARELGVLDRTVHLVEGHTPTLVRNALGVVVINSTVGLQALMRHKPLAVLGEALYRRPGLCFDGSLDQFWSQRPPPDAQQTRDFLRQLLALTQVQCNLYGPRSEPLHWCEVSPDA